MPRALPNLDLPLIGCRLVAASVCKLAAELPAIEAAQVKCECKWLVMFCECAAVRLCTLSEL